ncbi:MAG TPA: MinD/ParA family protein [Candidatus Binatus sp.]|nr:MinD/ParA family protein [Candidatus Binatus sp.]
MARTIAIHSFKGGTGKSTITANVAVALVAQGKRVGVMDMDLEGPGLHVIFGVDPGHVQFTLNDVLLDKAQPGQAAILMNGNLGLKNPGELYFTPASVNVTQMLQTLRTGFELESFASAISKLQNQFRLDYLLIDTHPGLENDTLLVMSACDHLLIVSRIDQQDIFGTGVLVQIAENLGKPTHLVLNMIPASLKSSDASRLAKRLGAQFKVDVAGWLPFSEEVQSLLSRSVFILTAPKQSMATKFQELARQLESFS